MKRTVCYGAGGAVEIAEKRRLPMQGCQVWQGEKQCGKKVTYTWTVANVRTGDAREIPVCGDHADKIGRKVPWRD